MEKNRQRFVTISQNSISVFRKYRIAIEEKKLFSDGQCLMFLNQANRFGVHCTVINLRSISNRVVCSVSLFEVR